MARRTGAGRIGGLEEARQLVALVGALNECGDVLTADSLISRLGVSRETAMKMLMLIVTAGDEEDSFLSVSSSDDFSEVSLAFSGGMRGKSVRLTKSETIAAIAALNLIGVPADDPLRVSLGRSLLSPAVKEDELKRVLAPMNPTREATELSACASALAQGHAISFDYQGSLDASPRRRHVEPTSLEQREGNWYLDGFDLDRMGLRRFRVDRMTDVSDEGPSRGVGAEARQEPSRTVEIAFSDLSYLSLFAWPGLKLARTDETSAEGTIPYYGGMWLPRRIAACSGTVTTTDDEVMRLARSYAADQLALM